MTAPGFGELAPTDVQRRWIALAHRLPTNYFGKRAASLLLRLAGGKSRRAFDVGVFGSEKVRLHPYDNISEKRVFITPQFWEAEERCALAAFIHASEGTFSFVDVGANAGLYTLYARSIAHARGRQFRAVCVEPAETMLSRLRFNIEASGAAPEISVFPVIAGAHAGEARFAINETNRGESRVAEDGSLAVAVRPLTQMIDEAGLSRVDALKIDIEGGEYEALYPFFVSTGAHFWPKMIIAETSHERDGASLMQLLEDKGYKVQVKTARNVVVTRRSGL